MLTTNQTELLPLDLTSITDLLNSPETTIPYTLPYTLHTPSPDKTELHIDIQHINPDSIQIHTTDTAVCVTGKTELYIQDSETVPIPLTLGRTVDLAIPFPTGCSPHNVYSDIVDTTLIIHIALIPSCQ
jgi:hypothetical protein